MSDIGSNGAAKSFREMIKVLLILLGITIVVSIVFGIGISYLSRYMG